ncbi:MULTISPECIES: protein-disulfide reductase DsbD [Alphaproteobacteria]|uniref:Thiol:disulfide interchange protein DsbD n=2 Tax=Alphaproteobacteria TaxID=28211 RepID=A0A840C7X3_9HYPH|nr:protein-disulfide reductase DsbD [Chelatococcus caeni]MBB4020132.1 thiol:disulfide interchange protein DsbD [Chelatococcus caeni]
MPLPSRTIWSVLVAVLMIAIAAISTPASAQVTSTGGMPLPVDQAFQLSATREGDEGVRLQWTIASGYYLYHDKFGVTQGASDLAMPELQGNGQSKDDPTFGPSTVFHDHVAAVVPLGASASGPLEVHYQGCQDNGICYPPIVRHVDVTTLAVTDPQQRAPATQAHEWTAPISGAPALASGVTIAADNGGLIGSLLKDGGVAMVLASFLMFGVLLAFTPCVFPMYPILAGAIARQGDSVTAVRGFNLSLAYVLAMATAFGLLGVVAAWSGQNLQMALQSPLAIGAVSILFVILALSMFGLFELQLPSAWVNAIGRIGQGDRGSLASAALLGFTSALIVGPCVTAPLAGALIYIAQTGDVALGAASLFALGLGKGIPLIAFGTLGPKALPKAGAWMTSVRQAFGFVFVATAIWMVSRLIPAEAALALWALFAIGLAVWLGAFDSLGPDAPGRRRTAKAAGIAAALYGIVLAVGAASGANDPFRPLSNLTANTRGGAGSAQALAFRNAATPAELRTGLAAGNGKPSLLYVTADWCITCAVIDRSILSDPAVQSTLARFNLIKLDVSANTPDQRQIMQSLQVVGPPTMIFVGPEGQEATGTRLVGDVTKATLWASVERTGLVQ